MGINHFTKAFTPYVLQVFTFSLPSLVSEFDINIGNTLSCKVPKDASFSEFFSLPDRNLSDLCLPDGAHIFEQDTTMIFLTRISADKKRKSRRPSNKKTKQTKTENVNNQPNMLFGLVLFRNKKDSTQKRGAVQKSIVLFSYLPLFSVWEPLMRAAMHRCDICMNC